jgi:heme-degrading monooxygenase HmoA
MVYTLFFSRMRDMNAAEHEAYEGHAGSVRAAALAGHPGFVSLKTYVAEDGERLSVVVFRDADSRRAWRQDPVHREAQAKGREDYYAEYRIVNCDEVEERAWARPNAEVSG